jgi:hypothetical protein
MRRYGFICDGTSGHAHVHGNGGAHVHGNGGAHVHAHENRADQRLKHVEPAIIRRAVDLLINDSQIYLCGDLEYRLTNEV